MAAQRILSAPSLTLAVESIVTMPMEAGSGVMAVVVFFAMENNGEIGTDSDHFVPSREAHQPQFFRREGSCGLDKAADVGQGSSDDIRTTWEEDKVIGAFYG